MKKWEVILVILLILTFFIFDSYSKKRKDEKCTLSVTGKIYTADIDIKLNKYYGFKFFYNKKLYKSTHFIENKNFLESGELNESLVGRCFEVKINPEEPETCKLILKNEIDCGSFLDNR